MKKTIFACLTLVLLVGCQSTSVEEASEGIVDKNPAPLEKVDNHGTPFSSGPTTSPEESVVGPSSAPPESDVSAQAVTTSEDIRLTLPRKTS